ncbi:hypothetical protein IKU74_07715 [bacterium]|nr:hypothetical protein [bacterium]
MKKLLALLILLSINMPAFAVTYEELTSPMPPAYRTGLSELPEQKYVETPKIEKEYITKEENEYAIDDLTYADLSIKKISSEVARELSYDEKVMMGDLSLLWRGAASKSDTIAFALYKLSNPDEDKPDEKSVKKVLTTIASMSTLVGAGIGNPLIATGSMLSGNILGIMSQDTKALNYKYTRVTDADMIILVRKIEELQQTTVNLYYNYMTARKMLGLLDKVVIQRKKNYDMAQDESREIIMITDAYYRSAIDAQTKAKADYMAKRAALEQFVGNETFIEFEKTLNERDKEELN